MSIYFETEDIEMPSLNEEKVSLWVETVAAQYGKEAGDITYIFCSDEKILEINKEYLQHDYYTDIITFDYSEEDIISGDLFISLDTVKSNSEELKTKYEEELHRVIIHGVLHLCGFGDKSEKEEEEMRKLEDKALAVYAKL